MSDIDLYKNSTDAYEELQNKRPDYVGARQAFIDFAIKYLRDKKDLTIAYFCCGMGNNTKFIASKIHVTSAVLIDINKEFLEIAKKSGINVKNIDFINSDILTVQLRPICDGVISMFAYHHVPNSEKINYLERVKDTLKNEGTLLLGEIYSPDKETTIRYYDYLLEQTGNKDRALRDFLHQTAHSDDFEYKVSREFAHKQLRLSGFELIDSKKIWPIDTTFLEDVGTFVEVWKLIN
jgi:ubiquinone/menaquinone biosynthesis C-methylase UbiE